MKLTNNNINLKINANSNFYKYFNGNLKNPFATVIGITYNLDKTLILNNMNSISQKKSENR